MRIELGRRTSGLRDLANKEVLCQPNPVPALMTVKVQSTDPWRSGLHVDDARIKDYIRYALRFLRLLATT